MKHAAAHGETVVLLQSDEIQESFYDIFNQRFACVNQPNRKMFYAQIAIGAEVKPCQIDPKFQCVLIVKESELLDPSITPSPFLNRFEKYALSHEILLTILLNSLPYNLQKLCNDVTCKVFSGIMFNLPIIVFRLKCLLMSVMHLVSMAIWLILQVHYT